MSRKTIDAVDMTRKIRDRNFEKLRNASRVERLAYYKERARQMDDTAANLMKSATDTPGRT